MKKYKALTCEFITKSYENPNGKAVKLYFKGYFLFNDNLEIYRQIFQLKKDNIYNIANYRHTDKRMLKTKYYNKENVKKFRDIFLDIPSIDKLTLETRFENYINLDNKKITQINKALLTNESFIKTTVKTIASYFTGSNPAGTELNWKANPFIIVNNNQKYDGGNLLNVITKYTNNKTKWEDVCINDLSEIEEYSIDDFKKISPRFNDIFLDTNKQFLKLSDEVDLNYKDEEFTVKSKTNSRIPNSTKFENINEYYEFVKQKLLSRGIELNIENKKDISDKLYSYFKMSCNLCEKLGIYKNLYSVANDGGADIVNAHIIGRNKTLLKWILEEKDFFKRINLFLYGIKHLNCLNLTPNLHKNYDDNKISINPETGKIYDVKNKTYLNKWVHEDELNDKKEYLKRNWDYFLKNNRNL